MEAALETIEIIKTGLILGGSAAAIVGAPFAIIKGYLDVLNLRRARSREEYKFAKEFLQEVLHNNSMHPYLKKKGYQTIAGVNFLSNEEIAYLLLPYGPNDRFVGKSSPEQPLRDYVKGRKYLKLVKIGDFFELQYKGKYKNKWTRQWRKVMGFMGYFGGGFLLLATIFVANFWKNVQKEPLIGVLVYSYIFILMWLSINYAANILNAEFLVENQHERQKTVRDGDGNGIG